MPPTVLGVNLANRTHLYYTALALAALLYVLCRYLVRTPFGLALQGIRDSADRMRALGYNVFAYRLAAFSIAGFIASCAGIIGLFYNRQIVPDGFGLIRSIDVLIVAVLGGMGHLAGAFVGAVGLSMVQNFAQTFTARHLTLTGVVFILVLLFFPGGVMGIWDQFKRQRAWMGRLVRPRAAAAAGAQSSSPDKEEGSAAQADATQASSTQ